MAAVDMAHEGRVDGIAAQLARTLRQFVGNVSRHGECHVLELAYPARAILRRDDQAWAVRTVGAAAMPQRALGAAERPGRHGHLDRVAALAGVAIGALAPEVGWRRRACDAQLVPHMAARNDFGGA